MYNRLALLALGANIAPAGQSPLGMLFEALRGLDAVGLRPHAVSPFYRTPAFPVGSGPDFINACVAVDPQGQSPEDLLATLHRVEAELGRVRVRRWGARVIDIDLLALGDAIRPDAETEAHWRALPPEEQGRIAPEGLILPHPRLSERAFVLIPLADIAPLWRHPATGRSVAEMVAALPEAEKAQIRPVSQANASD